MRLIGGQEPKCFPVRRLVRDEVVAPDVVRILGVLRIDGSRTWASSFDSLLWHSEPPLSAMQQSNAFSSKSPSSRLESIEDLVIAEARIPIRQLVDLGQQLLIRTSRDRSATIFFSSPFSPSSSRSFFASETSIPPYLRRHRIERQLRDVVLATDLTNVPGGFRRPQDPDDLLFREPCSLHPCLLLPSERLTPRPVSG